MPFTFKLSKRLAISRVRALTLVAIATAIACDSGERVLSSSHPSLSTATGDPATITDLAVSAVSDSSATLTFTEVDDGIGQPATYDVRFSAGAISWGEAPSASRGTCATPVAGSAIGAKRTCTVLGLAPGTGYQFQMVAFRGTFNVDAVFGTLSNVATGTTAGTVSGLSGPVDTVFAEGFESGNLSAWADGADATRHRVVSDPTFAEAGGRYLEVTYPAGSDGGWLTHFFMPGYDSLYVSYYVRFPTNWQGSTKLIAFYGSRTDNQWSAMGQAGNCPSGTDFFAAMLVTDPAGNPGATRFYSYYPAMAREPDGVTCWGRGGDATYVPPAALSVGAWHHVEFWVKLNTPGQSNAYQTFWQDGVQRGTWGGLSFRSSTILRLNSVQLTFSNGGSPQTERVYVDHLVVLTARPGP